MKVNFLLKNSFLFSNRINIEHRPFWLDSLRITFLFSSQKIVSSVLPNTPALSKKNANQQVLRFEDTVNSYVTIASEYPFFQPDLLNFSFQSLQGQLSQNAKALICWRCLQSDDQEWLNKAYDILFPQNAHLKFTQPKQKLKAKDVFQTYFRKRITHLFLTISSSSASRQQVMSCLNTLVFMEPSSIIKEQLEHLDSRIFDKPDNQILLSMYTHILIRNELPYEANLAKITLILESKQVAQTAKLRIAYLMASVPYFFRYYPKELVKSIFKVLKNSLPFMSNSLIFRCLKAVYQNSSRYALSFVQAVTKFILEADLDKEEGRIGLLTEIVLKTVSYSRVLEHSCEHLLSHLIQHPQQYSKAIQFSGHTHQSFVNLALLQAKSSQSSLSQEFQLRLQSYLQAQINRFAESPAIEYSTFLSFVQVSQKYSSCLKPQLVAGLREKVIAIFQQTQNSVPLRLVYEGLLFVLGGRKGTEGESGLGQKQQKTVIRMVQMFLAGSCERQFDSLIVVSNLNQCINLVSKLHLSPLSLNAQTLPDLFNLNLQTKGYSMDIETFENLVRYLVQAGGRHQQQLKQLFKQLQPIASSFLNSRRVSFRSTLNLSELAAMVDHQNGNLYRKIQRSIFQMLEKFPSFVISTHDLHTLKRNLVKRGVATKNIQFLVSSGIQHPQKWSQIRQQYLKRQMNYADQRSKWGKGKSKQPNKDADKN